MNSRILPTLALAAALGIFFLYVSPTWSGPISKMRTAIASDDRALAAATIYAKQQNQLATARNAIDPSDLARLATFLPASVDNVGLMLDLDALAARSGLSLSDVDVIMDPSFSRSESSDANVLSAAGRDPVGSVDLSLSAVGTYAALKTFLVGVEKSQRLIDVRELSLKGSDTGVYNYRMRLRFYWLR